MNDDEIDWYDKKPDPCPKCGSNRTVLLNYFRWDSASVCRIECRQCDHSGPEVFFPEDAHDLWNKAGRK